MNYDEIVKTARSEDPAAVTFDMRKFPEEQGDAVETFLLNTGLGVQMGVLKHTKPIIVMCDSKATVSARAEQLLAALQAKGVHITIQHSDW